MTRFNSKTQIIISDDLKTDIYSLLQEERAKNVALMLDSNIAPNPEIKQMRNFLAGKVSLNVYTIKAAEPTTDLVNKYKSRLKDIKIDLIIGIGGGSTIDLAKALSVMCVNKGKVEDYHGTGKPFQRGIKKIMIPTTAGTGSEVTPGAVLTNVNTKFKRSIAGKYVTPDYAVLNAKVTLSMPDIVTASTGMDALAHAVESYTAKNSNVITKMYSKQAFSLIYNNLPKVFADKRNSEYRKNLLLGSCLAGYAIYNSNTGACHSMAYPLGIYHEIPHGIAVAHLLPKVINVNIAKGCFIYADLYDLVENTDKKRGSPKFRAGLFASLLEQYPPLTYINKTFSAYGVNKDNYKFLAERGLDLTPALNNNPVEFGLPETTGILKEILSGTY